MHDAVDQRQDEQRERQPNQDLLGDEHCVGGRNEDDRARDKGAEQHAQCKTPRDGASERRHNALGQSRVVQRLLDRAARRCQDALFGNVDYVVAGLRRRAGSRLDSHIGDKVRDALLGGRLGCDRKLLVVALALPGVAQNAAGVIDEPERFFDVALPVARLRVILADQATQRRAHLLVRGGLRYTQSFVQRRFHGRDRGQNATNFDAGIFR